MGQFAMIYVLTESDGHVRSRMEYAVATGLSMAGFDYRFVPELRGDEGIVLCYGSKTGALDAFCRDGGILIEMHPCAWLYDPETDPTKFRSIQDFLLLPLSPSPPLPLSSVLFWGDAALDCKDDLLTIRRIGRGVHCTLNADLFGNLFFHLSRLEERLCPERDELGRFRSGDSLLGKSDLLHRPVVDETVGWLIRTVTECCRLTGNVVLRKAFWPRGEHFAAFLSHDVDHPFKWTPKRIAYEAWRSARLLLGPKAAEGSRKIRRMIRSLPKRRDPYWTFEELMAWEEQVGVRSSFYFAAERRIRADPSYNIYDREVRSIARRLAARGWEIGLHGSYGSYNDLQLLKEDKRTFEHVLSTTAAGLRQHYLRFETDATWRNQELSGFEYDTTLAYADREGFRAGTSFPFHPYDFGREQAMHLMEIPLAIMDGTLAQYRGYDEKQAAECVQRFLKVARKHRGVFSFLLHQSFLDEEECPYMRRLYRDILSQIADEDVYCVTGRDLARWWRDRESLRIADCGGGNPKSEIRNPKSAEFILRSERNIPRIVLILEPIAHPQDWELSLAGCVYRRRNDEEAIRLDLSSVERNRTIRLCFGHVKRET